MLPRLDAVGRETTQRIGIPTSEVTFELLVRVGRSLRTIGPSTASKHLGLIHTPRQLITLAFSGTDKKLLYVGQMGVVSPDSEPWTTPQGVCNTAMTMYRIPMLSEGFKGRPK